MRVGTAMHELKALVIFTGLFKVISTAMFASCDKRFCFHLYYSEESESFEDAKRACRTKENSYLVVIDDEIIQGFVWKFLFASNAELLKGSANLIFFDMKRRDGLSKAWLMKNGSVYLGAVSNSEGDAPELCGALYYVGMDNNTNAARYEMRATLPWTLKPFICKFPSSYYRCKTESTNEETSVTYGGLCFVIYHGWKVSWWKARNECDDNGGDMAVFDYDVNKGSLIHSMPDFISKLEYWSGVCLEGSAWVSPSGSDHEATFNGWSAERTSSRSQCACMAAKADPKWSWKDCDCNAAAAFLCYRPIVSATVKDRPIAYASATESPPNCNCSNTERATEDKSKPYSSGATLGLILAIVLPMLFAILLGFVLLKV